MSRAFNWKFFAFFFIFLMVIPAHASVSRADLDRKIKEEERHFKILERQIKKRQELVSVSRKKEKSYLGELSRCDQKRKVAEQSLRLLDLKQKKTRKDISDMESEILRLKKDITRVKKLLAERLIAMYKFGGIAELNLLLSSQNVSDAMNTGYLLGKIAEQDQNMISSIDRETVRIRSLADNLSLREKDLMAKKKAIELEKRQLGKVLDSRKKLLTKLRRNRSAHLASIKEFEEDQREIKGKIQSFIKKKAVLSRKNSSNKKSSHLSAASHRGKLQWPLRGKITSPFGTRIHPVFKTKTVHTGIDIAAPMGKTVKSAGSGEVIYSGWLRGYGQIIIIDHGRSISTVYAHLSRILVSEGERVSVGQPIGLVGATGVATGPHLHFEVRVQGDAKNPIKYLRR